MAKIQKQLISIQSGQSLIELLIAMGVFVLAVSAIAFLILDAYIADRAGRERTQATFLAEECLEQARVTRDGDWDSLDSTSPETIDKFFRTMTVEDIDSSRKKITCQVTWSLTEARSQDVSLATYLTNWQEIMVAESCEIACQWEGYGKGKCKKPDKCKELNLGELAECTAPETCCCTK